MKKIGLELLLLVCLCGQGLAETITGVVAAVTDGDTKKIHGFSGLTRVDVPKCFLRDLLVRRKVR